MIAGGILGIVLILELYFQVSSVRLILPIFETQPVLSVRRASPCPDVEQIEFPTTDGLTLRGSLYRQSERPARGLILFCPELGGSHWLAPLYCQGLFEAGYEILSFNVRNQGESDALPDYQPVHWMTCHEVQDAQAALRYIDSRDDLKELPLAVFGVSRGGGVAIAAASKSKNIRCIACDSTYTADTMLSHYVYKWAKLYWPSWLIDRLPKSHVRMTLTMARWVSRIKSGYRYAILERMFPALEQRPVFLVSGRKDTYVRPLITERIAKKLEPHAEVWIAPRAKHNLARETDPEEYDQRMVDFFNQSIPEPDHSEPVASPAESSV